MSRHAARHAARGTHLRARGPRGQRTRSWDSGAASTISRSALFAPLRGRAARCGGGCRAPARNRGGRRGGLWQRGLCPFQNTLRASTCLNVPQNTRRKPRDRRLVAQCASTEVRVAASQLALHNAACRGRSFTGSACRRSAPRNGITGSEPVDSSPALAVQRSRAPQCCSSAGIVRDESGLSTASASV